MVTNPGETQMFSALGVKLGGRTTGPEPFELTRGTLKESVQAPVRTRTEPAAPSVAKPEENAEAGKCPFSSMLAGMKEGAVSKVTWSPEALERMEKIPDFVRPMVKSGIEAFAQKQGYHVITPKVIDESKSDQAGFEWTPGASQKLENIPGFIRPLAKKEIERMAAEKGVTQISEELIEEVKTRFGQFMPS